MLVFLKKRLVFLEKKPDFFRKKPDFFKIAKGGKFAVECVSNEINLLQIIVKSFCKKSEFFEFPKSYQNLMEILFFRLSAFILLKGIFNKIGGLKICW